MLVNYITAEKVGWGRERAEPGIQNSKDGADRLLDKQKVVDEAFSLEPLGCLDGIGT